VAHRLGELYKKHRALDDEVTELTKKFADDQIVNRKKSMKLWLKDEIYRLETELKDLG
jgi:hypothetical protein|tara:strand:+ start:308 stop:481 length:174 start_codon:yes stop_codon:yes gene_type:complete